MRLILCWLVVLSVVAFQGCQGRADEPKSEEAGAAELLGLVAPVDVKYWDMFDDGGTVGFKLVGAKRSTLAACFDGRLDSPSPRSIYIGALHPNRRGAQRLEPGGEEDRAVVLLIRAWLERRFSAQNLQDLREAARSNRFDSAELSGAGMILQALERREARLALYSDEEACARLLGLRAPVTLIRVVPPDSTSYSLGFVLKGEQDGTFRACFNRMAPDLPDNVWVGVTAPVKDGQRMLDHSLPFGSEKETAVLGLLNHWFQRNPPGARNESTAEGVEPGLVNLLFRRVRFYPDLDLHRDSVWAPAQ